MDILKRTLLETKISESIADIDTFIVENNIGDDALIQSFVFDKETFEEKSGALNIITQHYGGDYYSFSENELEKVNIIKIEIVSITGKKAGY